MLHSPRTNIKHCLIALLLYLPACWLSTVVAAEKSALPSILIVGDSLSAGYGIKLEQGWVNLLQRRIAEDYQVINASISGDTSKGALQRLPKLLAQHQPGIVIIEIGGNDGLRGQSLKAMQDNIAAMIEMSRTYGDVLLLGIRIPPNYGQRYTEKFAAVYATLSRQYQIPLVPVFMQNVGDDPELMQKDGVHPNDKAQSILLNNVWPQLQPLL